VVQRSDRRIKISFVDIVLNYLLGYLECAQGNTKFDEILPGLKRSFFKKLSYLDKGELIHFFSSELEYNRVPLEDLTGEQFDAWVKDTKKKYSREKESIVDEFAMPQTEKDKFKKEDETFQILCTESYPLSIPVQNQMIKLGIPLGFTQDMRVQVRPNDKENLRGFFLQEISLPDWLPKSKPSVRQRDDKQTCYEKIFEIFYFLPLVFLSSLLSVLGTTIIKGRSY
jgi:hypothetical protein